LFARLQQDASCVRAVSGKPSEHGRGIDRTVNRSLNMFEAK
jgi:hypothetical protein